MIQRVVPNLFYASLADGLELFVDCLGFEVVHQDGDLAVVKRDGAKVNLMENSQLALLDRPEIALETDTIDELYKEIAARKPERLHPNSKEVSLRPWGAREFAVLDKTDVCVIFRQWT